MKRINLASLALSVSLLTVSACGGGGGSDSGSPTPTPTPTGSSFTATGSANKGLIFGGNVSVVDPSNPSVEIARGTTSTLDAGFSFSASNFTGDFVKVTVSGGAGATMVCDLPAGCRTKSFGDLIDIGTGFEMSALVAAPSNNNSLTVHVNPFTTMATRLAEARAGSGVPDKMTIDAAYSQVADLFGLDTSELWTIPAVDLTTAPTGAEPSALALKVAFLSAGILEGMFEADGSPGKRFALLIDDFADHDGQLVLNEQTDVAADISVEDIFEGAFGASTETTATGDNRDAASTQLEAGYLAVAAAPPGVRSAELPVRAVLGTVQTSLVFDALKGTDVPEQNLDITGDDIPWFASVGVPWISVTPSSGTGPAQVSVTASSVEADPGDNRSIITISDQQTPKKIEVVVDFKVGDVLKVVGSQTLTVQAATGETDTIAVPLRLASDRVNWQASSTRSWATLDTTTGTSPSDLTVSVDPSGLVEGTHSAIITFKDNDYDQDLSVQIDLVIEPPRLNVSEVALPLSSFPNSSILQRSVEVSDTLGGGAEWEASSNVSWLTVTAAGETGEPLMITADPSGLDFDTVHLAQVTVTSPDPAIDNSEVINVSLWRGQNDPVESARLAGSSGTMDPSKPYTYRFYTLSQSDILQQDGQHDLFIYNVYTGRRLAWLENVIPFNGNANRFHRPQAVSPDGQTLYLYDDKNSKIVPMNTSDFSFGASWDIEPTYSLSIGRVNGQTVLFTSTGNAYNPDTHQPLNTDFGALFSDERNLISVSRNENVLCATGIQAIPYSVHCFHVDYSYSDGGKLSLHYKGEVFHDLSMKNARDLAVSNDGTRAYVAAQNPAEINVFDLASWRLSQQLSGGSSAKSVEVSPNGKIYGLFDGGKVITFDNEGNNLNSVTVNDSSQLVISGDGTRMVVGNTLLPAE